jgi:hypothetical protein
MAVVAEGKRGRVYLTPSQLHEEAAAAHEVAVHDWEIPAGGNAPLWMNTKLAWADRLIAVISPDYLPASAFA